MRREGFVRINVDKSVLNPKYSKPDIYEKNRYNRDFLTNATVKYPYAHKHYGRSSCCMCSQESTSGRTKRKQMKLTLNKDQFYFRSMLEMNDDHLEDGQEADFNCCCSSFVPLGDPEDDGSWPAYNESDYETNYTSEYSDDSFAYGVASDGMKDRQKPVLNFAEVLANYTLKNESYDTSSKVSTVEAEETDLNNSNVTVYDTICDRIRDGPSEVLCVSSSIMSGLTVDDSIVENERSVNEVTIAIVETVASVSATTTITATSMNTIITADVITISAVAAAAAADVTSDCVLATTTTTAIESSSCDLDNDADEYVFV